MKVINDEFLKTNKGLLRPFGIGSCAAAKREKRDESTWFGKGGVGRKKTTKCQKIGGANMPIGFRNPVWVREEEEEEEEALNMF